MPEQPLPPPPEEMQAPGDGDFPGPREHSGGSIRSPLGPLPRPDHNSIPDGPVSTMLVQADAYAAAHPEDFRGMVERYRQVQMKSRGTPQEQQADEKLQTVVQQHRAALRKTIQEYEGKMDAQLRARQPQAAYDVWKNFPQNLRTFESDEQISEILQRKLPPGFMPR